MFICICNAIRESDFRAAARAHPEARTEEIYAAIGRPPQCGQCLAEAGAVLKAEREAHNLPVFCAN